ncbi:hypothetical protein E8E91_03130 [Pseudomonas sp. BN515]|nr:hypothetical protein [Pseudomonas sp. BN515]
MWAVLGSIEFEILGHPSAQSERTTAEYAEHARLRGKPLLEWIGEGLDEVSLEITLHAAVGDPEAQLRRLKQAKSAHEPLPYVLGSGDYRGIYLITALDVTTRKTEGSGRLVAASLNLTLREYTGKYTKPLPVPRGLLSGAGVLGLAANPDARVGGAALPAVTPFQQALSMGRKAAGLLRQGMDVYRTVQGVSDPLAAMSQAPRLLSLGGQALDSLLGLSGAAELMESGADLVQLGASAASEVNQAQDALGSATPETILNQVDYAAGRIATAMTQMDGAAPRFARMAADIVTRRA